ncbi:hypothetical protein [Streptomyces spiramyceticus]|uniref:hypothetical protein n=1 Tax=Streptomyces spiramyceticus TaxID=299717 RepID=UPI00237BA840|nr:hypothetical protein [Streptomyces spiramyceticus]
MAVPQMIAGPGAYILYSGPQHTFETHEATLAALADTKYVGTDPGLAALYEPLQGLLDRSVAEGHAADGLSRLMELLRQS